MLTTTCIYIDRCRYSSGFSTGTLHVYELHVIPKAKICYYLNTEIPQVSLWFKHVHFTAQSKIATLNFVVMLHCVLTLLHLLTFNLGNQQCWLKKSSLTLLNGVSLTAVPVPLFHISRHGIDSKCRDRCICIRFAQSFRGGFIRNWINAEPSTNSFMVQLLRL